METDESYKQVAVDLAEATHILIAAGAGASADSNLLVFSQVSSLDALQRQGKTYDQVASLNSFARTPRSFYGFWCSSMKSYADAAPHDGYTLLKKWCDSLPRPADGSPCPWFVLTTNVDSMFKRSGFDRASISEVHGSLDSWQCGGVPSGSAFPLFSSKRCSDKLFSAPNMSTMMFEPKTLLLTESATYPHCPLCKIGWARPNVYLFGDGDCFVDDASIVNKEAYANWKQSVFDSGRVIADGAKLVILEIGCGLRVPTLRRRCEDLTAECGSARYASRNSSVKFVRINPEFSRQSLTPGITPTTSIADKALDALMKINKLWLDEKAKL